MEKVAPRGGAREGAGRKKEFDGIYPLKYREADRKRWERKAAQAEKDLSEWIRNTLNAAAAVNRE